MKKGPSVLVIFLTVFIDLIGFGIIVPLIALYSKSFGRERLMIGIIGASFSAAQFVFAPIWGRLSDRMGRRPILLISTAGAALSYVMFAIGSGVSNNVAALAHPGLFRERSLERAAATSPSRKPISPTSHRRKTARKGWDSSAWRSVWDLFAGRSLGGLGLKISRPYRTGLAGCGHLRGKFPARIFHPRGKPHALLRTRQGTAAFPAMGAYSGPAENWPARFDFFLATFAFSCFEITLPLLINDNFHLGITNIDEIRGATTIVYLFVFCGFIGAFVQGGATGRLVKMLGEPKLIAVSLVMTGVSLALLPMIKGNGQLFWSHLFHSDNGPWVKDAPVSSRCWQSVRA